MFLNERGDIVYLTNTRPDQIKLARLANTGILLIQFLPGYDTSDLVTLATFK